MMREQQSLILQLAWSLDVTNASFKRSRRQNGTLTNTRLLNDGLVIRSHPPPSCMSKYFGAEHWTVFVTCAKPGEILQGHKKPFVFPYHSTSHHSDSRYKNMHLSRVHVTRAQWSAVQIRVLLVVCSVGKGGMLCYLPWSWTLISELTEDSESWSELQIDQKFLTHMQQRER